MNGGIAGGIDALFNGQNFFAGLYRGAVMGAAIGGIGWAVSQLINAIPTNGNHEYRALESDVYRTPDNYNSDKVKYSYGTVHEFQDSYGGLGKYGVDNVYLQTPKGYGVAKDGLFYEKTWWENLWGFDRNIPTGDILGLTTPSNDIYLSRGTFVSKSQFVETLTHETGHVILNNSKYVSLAYGTTKNMGEFSNLLDNMGHVSIRKMSIELFNKNTWLNKMNWMKSSYFQRFLNNSNPNLDRLLSPLIKSFKF